MPPAPDELPPAPRRSAAVADLRKRLNRLGFRGRFSLAVDLKLLAATWATDYASQVFPQVQDDQRIRLLLAAEAGFLAAIEMSKNGIHNWERLLEEPPSSPTMTTAMFYLVQTPEVSVTWISGELIPAESGHVWLTTPSGKPVLKVPSNAVTVSTKEETANRIIADKQAANARNN
jgi:hypothetical protein